MIEDVDFANAMPWSRTACCLIHLAVIALDGARSRPRLAPHSIFCFYASTWQHPLFVISSAPGLDFKRGSLREGPLSRTDAGGNKARRHGELFFSRERQANVCNRATRYTLLLEVIFSCISPRPLSSPSQSPRTPPRPSTLRNEITRIGHKKGYDEGGFDTLGVGRGHRGVVDALFVIRAPDIAPVRH